MLSFVPLCLFIAHAQMIINIDDAEREINGKTASEEKSPAGSINRAALCESILLERRTYRRPGDTQSTSSAIPPDSPGLSRFSPSNPELPILALKIPRNSHLAA